MKRRGCVESAASHYRSLLPVVLFAVITVVSQIVSPARGQSFLPELPGISVRPWRAAAAPRSTWSPDNPG